MFASTAELGRIFVQGVWNMFGIYVPGFAFTFGQFWIGVAIASLSLHVIRYLFNIGGSGGESSRTTSTDDPKISEERRHDEF